MIKCKQVYFNIAQAPLALEREDPIKIMAIKSFQNSRVTARKIGSCTNSPTMKLTTIRTQLTEAI